ncbi:MAG: TlpA disulfide reductase family protein [Dissulfuribacterales bacterium]
MIERKAVIVKKGLIKLQLVAILLFSLFFSACQGNAGSSKAPDFTLLDVTSKMVNLSDFKGKMVLINFFATYCPPCRAEIPDFIKLQDKYRDKGFVVIGISVDEDWREVLPDFIQKKGMNYPVLIATSKVVKDYGNVYALPTSFLLDKNHNIVKKFTGMLSESELEPLIKQYLAQ